MSPECTPQARGPVLVRRRPPAPPGLGEALKARLRRSCVCSVQGAWALLQDLFPATRWLRQYRLREDLAGDTMSGLVIGIILVPQAIAYSLLAGLPPVYSLYTSFFANLIYFLMGTSRHVSVGIFSLLCLMVGQVVDRELLLAGFDPAQDGLGPGANSSALNASAATLVLGLQDCGRDCYAIRVATALTLVAGIYQVRRLPHGVLPSWARAQTQMGHLSPSEQPPRCRLPTWKAKPGGNTRSGWWLNQQGEDRTGPRQRLAHDRTTGAEGHQDRGACEASRREWPQAQMCPTPATRSPQPPWLPVPNGTLGTASLRVASLHPALPGPGLSTAMSPPPKGHPGSLPSAPGLLVGGGGDAYGAGERSCLPTPRAQCVRITRERCSHGGHLPSLQCLCVHVRMQGGCGWSPSGKYAARRREIGFRAADPLPRPHSVHRSSWASSG